MSAICIIPARGGSKRIPRKNIRLFHGKPIIAYSIEVAEASGLFADCYVSTEDEEIQRIALRYGAGWVRREPSQTGDEVGTQAVMSASIAFLGADRADTFCCIYPCAPLLLPEYLRLAHSLVEAGRDYAFSVGTEPFLHDAGAFYFGRTQAFLDDAPLFDLNTAMVPLPANRVCDVNVEADWMRCERMWAELNP